MKAWRAICNYLNPPPRPPRELLCVSWKKADGMLRAGDGWRIAPEEDHSRLIGMVWLERDAPDPGIPAGSA